MKKTPPECLAPSKATVSGIAIIFGHVFSVHGKCKAFSVPFSVRGMTTATKQGLILPF